SRTLGVQRARCKGFRNETLRKLRRSICLQIRQHRDQKLAEPVSLSSTLPTGFRLPPTTARMSFDLLALRARRKRHTRVSRLRMQGPGRRYFPQIANVDRFFLAEEARREVRDEDEEEDRLLDGHRDAGDPLVAERVDPPEPRRVLVEGVDRLAEQRQQQAHRRGKEEGGGQVERLRARAQP